MTARKFKPPVAFQFAAMTNEADFRIAYAADQIIFNWEGNRDELRVDGGPASGRHKQGAGRLPVGKWVTIELVVTEDELTLKVDGEERYRTSADFTTVDQTFSAHATGGNVAIKDLRMLPLRRRPSPP